MTQPRISPLQHHGPWLGLNDTVAPRELSPAFATVAHNVILAEGLIRPRAPWRALGGLVASGHRILSLFHWHTRERDRHPLVFAKTTNHGSNLSAGRLWQLQTADDASELFSRMSPWPAQFHVVGKTLYVIDGGQKMVRVTLDPIRATRIGILPPVRGTAEFFNHPFDPRFLPVGMVVFAWDHADLDYNRSFSAAAGSGISGSYSYAVTHYDSTTGRESNPVISESSIQVSNERPKILINQMSFESESENQPPTDAGIDEIRVYRRNDGLGSSFFRLVAQQIGFDSIDPFENQQTFLDSLADEDITVSNANTGPFAPSRNGIPPASRCAAFYNDRMFYGPLDDPGKVYYSELGQPDHVDGGAFLNVTGDESDDVNGLLAVGSQLHIGKSRSIHILSGTISAATNTTRAHGALDSELAKSSHQVFKSKADIGPMNGFGNNFILAGQPGMIIFGTDAGLFSFDGQSSRNLSVALISKTWKAFIQRGSGFHTQARLTFAVDPHKRILYVCNGRIGNVVGPPILAYHYATGAWTTVSEHQGPDEISSITCVATSLGDRPGEDELQTFDLREASLMVGFVNRKAEVSTESENDDIRATRWRYETGDLAVEPTIKKHFYKAKIMLKRASRFWGNSPAVSVGYRRNGTTFTSRKTLSMINSEPVRVVPLQRQAHDIRLVFQRSDQWDKGWSPDVGITGFALSAELAGET